MINIIHYSTDPTPSPTKTGRAPLIWQASPSLTLAGAQSFSIMTTTAIVMRLEQRSRYSRATAASCAGLPADRVTFLRMTSAFWSASAIFRPEQTLMQTFVGRLVTCRNCPSLSPIDITELKRVFFLESNFHSVEFGAHFCLTTPPFLDNKTIQ